MERGDFVEVGHKLEFSVTVQWGGFCIPADRCIYSVKCQAV